MKGSLCRTPVQRTLAMMQQLIADIMPEVEVMHLVEES